MKKKLTQINVSISPRNNTVTGEEQNEILENFVNVVKYQLRKFCHSDDLSGWMKTWKRYNVYLSSYIMSMIICS